MGTKRLVLLGAILAVLVAAVLIRSLSHREESIVEQAALKRFAPEDFSQSRIRKIELYQGRHSDKRVVLRRDGDDWRVASLFDAPADVEKIQRLVKKIKEMKGEFRSQSADVLGDYRLSDETALHYLIYGSQERPLLHLLAGRRSGTQSFVREQGSDAVYAVKADLRSEAGLYGEVTEPPKASAWMQKTIAKIKKDRIRRISLTYPDKKLVFAREPIPVEPDQGGETGKEAPAGQKGPESGKPAKTQWKLVQGGEGLLFQRKGLDTVLRALASLRANDAADPEKKAQWGLHPALWRADVVTEDEKQHIIYAGRPGGAGEGYVMRSEDPTVYKVSSWVFEDLFPPGSRLFSLKGYSAKPEELARVELRGGPVDLTLEKAGKTWRLLSPPSGLKLKPGAADDLGRALAGLKPSDFAEPGSGVDFGLDDPWLRVTFRLKNGPAHTLTIGGRSLAHDGRYARFDDEKTILCVSAGDIERIRPRLGRLLDLNVIKWKKQEIQAVAVSGKAGGFELSRRKGGWRIRSGGEESEADPDRVERLLAALVSIHPVDAMPGVTLREPVTSVTVEERSGPRTTIRLDGEGRLRVPGVALTLKIPQTALAQLAPDPGSLIKQKPSSEKTKKK